MKTSCTSLLQCCIVLLGVLALPRVEAATITVDTLADAIPPATDGACSLREALANANNDAATYPDCTAGTGDDEITFAGSLFRTINQFRATIRLTGLLQAGGAGTPRALVIRPPAPAGSITPRVRLLASSEAPHRVLDVGINAQPFTLERISIEDGNAANGGGVRLFSQDAHFDQVHFLGNQSSSDGGGALFQMGGNGVLRITGCLFQNNRSVDSHGGAISLLGVKSVHQVLISDSVFEGNQATFDGGAIRFEVVSTLDPPQTPLLDLARSRFEGNSGRFGGAVFGWAGSASGQRLRLQVSDSLFLGNEASSGGGGVRVGSHAQSSQSSLRVQRSSFIDNRAAGGGGFNVSNLDVHVENSLFAGNEADVAGGLAVRNNNSSLPRTVSLVGNTFHRQRHLGVVPGRSIELTAPADAGSWTWTLSGNLFEPASEPSVTLECLVSGGSAVPLTLQGGDNLSPDPSCVFFDAADIQAATLVVASPTGDPLRPLAVLPQAGSPAIDAWPAEACTDDLEQPLDHDLRGEPRPADGDDSGTADCDIGAFELPGFLSDRIHADGFE